jgi:hypothetical protein
MTDCCIWLGVLFEVMWHLEKEWDKSAVCHQLYSNCSANTRTLPNKLSKSLEASKYEEKLRQPELHHSIHCTPYGIYCEIWQWYSTRACTKCKLTKEDWGLGSISLTSPIPPAHINYMITPTCYVFSSRINIYLSLIIYAAHYLRSHDQLSSCATMWKYYSL